ncbi:ISL3 family transposase, partial [Methylobacterium trifolii]|uniref:ISL3 family transposase n=1 Tax=Methylobacterium trifolii TaxID=1003092 RepID=UPI001EE0ECC6
MAVIAQYLRNWTVERVDTSQTGYRLFARFNVEPGHCQKCGSPRKPYKHGQKNVDYIDAPIHGRPTIISVDVRRYRCLDCTATFMQPLQDVHFQRRMTVRCIEHIRDQSLMRLFTHLAREIGLDEKTVRNISNEELDLFIANYRPSAPVALGISEIVLRGRKYALFVNLDDQRVLDLVEGSSRTIVVQWLRDLPDRSRIQIVIIDIRGPYREAVTSTLSEAVIIADKWFMIGQANDTLDGIRRQQWGKSKSCLNFGRGRRLLQASRHNLNEKRTSILNKVLGNNALLSAAWHCKEGFRDIWGYEHRPSRRDAEVMFKAWKACIPDEVSAFRLIAKTVEDAYEAVFAYFDQPFTIAATEAPKRLIKIVNRAGRAYAFDAIRARAILMPTHD